MHYSMEKAQQKSMQLLVAAGPFNTLNSMDYQPLLDLLKVVKKEQPHAVMLMGPFLDRGNSIVKDGELFYPEDSKGTDIRCAEYEDVFDSILNLIDQELGSLNTKVLLVPSLNEASHLCPFP